MIKLNLETKNKEQEIIKEYLENNASEVLAEKINNGVEITKDNKTLLNKKDLDDFWKYAYQEASKLRTNHQQVLGIEHNTVFSWAMHYFEEDDLIGKLYNEDGSEYNAPKPKNEPIKQTPTNKKANNNQATLFDLIDSTTPELEETSNAQIDDEEILEPEEPIEDDDEWTEEEMDEALKEIDEEFAKENNKVIDKSTGEIITPNTNEIQSIDKEYAIILSNLFESKMGVKL